MTRREQNDFHHWVERKTDIYDQRILSMIDRGQSSSRGFSGFKTKRGTRAGQSVRQAKANAAGPSSQRSLESGKGKAAER